MPDRIRYSRLLSRRHKWQVAVPRRGDGVAGACRKGTSGGVSCLTGDGAAGACRDDRAEDEGVSAREEGEGGYGGPPVLT